MKKKPKKKMIPFLTGTACYGPFKKKSDIDIGMLYHDARRLKELVEGMGVETWQTEGMEAYDTESFYFKIGNCDRAINVIAFRDVEEYHSWLHATEEMLDIGIIHDREERLEEFQLLREEFIENL